MSPDSLAVDEAWSARRGLRWAAGFERAPPAVEPSHLAWGFEEPVGPERLPREIDSNHGGGTSRWGRGCTAASNERAPGGEAAGNPCRHERDDTQTHQTDRSLHAHSS